jgi:hypothetical protein
MQLTRTPEQVLRTAKIVGSVALGMFLTALCVVGLLVLAAQATRT